ncbi:MAG: hypothetical protein GX561_14590 [Lentisphaerae bacterium]|nr:hypothetical protein [Lentisphaerota bacterium]
MKIMFLCFMFSGLFMAFGQTSRFTVKVVDHETGEPLPGMKVDGNVNSYAPNNGDWFFYDSLMPNDERTLVIPDDRFEIFSKIAESRSRALGQVPAVNGFGTTRNLQDLGYGDDRYSHSREFRSNVADEWMFWQLFIEDADLNSNQ